MTNKPSEQKGVEPKEEEEEREGRMGDVRWRKGAEVVRGVYVCVCAGQAGGVTRLGPLGTPRSQPC